MSGTGGRDPVGVKGVLSLVPDHGDVAVGRIFGEDDVLFAPSGALGDRTKGIGHRGDENGEVRNQEKGEDPGKPTCATGCAAQVAGEGQCRGEIDR